MATLTPPLDLHHRGKVKSLPDLGMRSRKQEFTQMSPEQEEWIYSIGIPMRLESIIRKQIIIMHLYSFKRGLSMSQTGLRFAQTQQSSVQNQIANLFLFFFYT